MTEAHARQAAMTLLSLPGAALIEFVNDSDNGGYFLSWFDLAMYSTGGRPRTKSGFTTGDKAMAHTTRRFGAFVEWYEEHLEHLATLRPGAANVIPLHHPLQSATAVQADPDACRQLLSNSRL